MFYWHEQDWDRQNLTQIVTEMCGFVTILSGTFLLHKTKDMVVDGNVQNTFLLSLSRQNNRTSLTSLNTILDYDTL